MKVTLFVPRIKFIAIQNGNRPLRGTVEQVTFVGPEPNSIYHSNFFCFGEHEVEEYTKHGATIDNFYPCGSLSDSFYHSLPHYNSLETSFDICLVVSPWNTIPYESLIYGNSRESYELFLSYLGMFHERNGRTIAAISKCYTDSDQHKDEVEWLQKYLGTEVSYVSKKKNMFLDNYLLTDNAEVVIGYGSTLLKENFGRGKKILECNYSDNQFLEFPIDGIWLLKKKGYEHFEERFLELLSMDAEDYKKKCMEYPYYLMANKENEPTHSVITKFIEQHLHAIDT